MRLDQLVYIKEIERQQSISKAARELFVSQPSLSVALNNLEQEIGVPIFIRSKQGVMPTLMGQVVLDKAATILQMVEELREIKQLTDQEIEGEMTIFLPFLSSGDLGYYLVTYFQEKYPKVRLKLIESDVMKSIQGLVKAQADVAIVDFWAMEEKRIRQVAEEANLMYGFVAIDELCLFVGKNHPLTASTYVVSEDLTDYPISSNRHRLWEYFSGHVPKGLRQGDLFEDCEHLKKALIKKQNAVIITSKKAMNDDIYVQTGSIVPLKIEERLKRQIIIASLIGKRDKWAHTEGIIYQELCDCVKHYFNK